MWPQLISSLAAGVALLVAAVMLNSAFGALVVAALCMIAWISHLGLLSERMHNLITAFGAAIALWLLGYLFLLT
jgi:hypothetical protein